MLAVSLTTLADPPPVNASPSSSSERVETAPAVPAIRIAEISTTIHPPLDADPADRFGVAVAIDPDQVFVGNDGRRDGPPAAGMVTIHERDEDGYRETARLQSPRSRPGDEFGADLAIDDTLLVVGAPGMDDERGGAWVFRSRNGGWTVIGRVR
ncbi:MAG: hypothetical protein GY825_03200, partial [Phycisphaeraceae bacterium]|nr:hypothetical protein [Phycisphaeraceae bacterium]